MLTAPVLRGTVEGVEVREIKTLVDERGFFREVARQDLPFFAEGFGKVSQTVLPAASTQDWQPNLVETVWWYVPLGVLEVALYDNRADSPTYGNLQEVIIGERQSTMLVKIPAGVAHSWKTQDSPTYLLCIGKI